VKTYRTPCDPPGDGFYWTTSRSVPDFQVVKVDRYDYGEGKKVEVNYIGTDEADDWKQVDPDVVFIGPIWPPETDDERAIETFWGPHRFLSNFHPADVTLDGDRYRTVEHAYQAAKTLDDTERADIRAVLTPREAKALGQRVTLRQDWDYVKVNAMLDLLRQKFRQEPLKGRLLATGDKRLIEGNTWGDTFWGVCDGVGENWLGRLLMQVRGELQKQ